MVKLSIHMEVKLGYQTQKYSASENYYTPLHIQQSNLIPRHISKNHCKKVPQVTYTNELGCNIIQHNI